MSCPGKQLTLLTLSDRAWMPVVYICTFILVWADFKLCCCLCVWLYLHSLWKWKALTTDCRTSSTCGCTILWKWVPMQRCAMFEVSRNLIIFAQSRILCGLMERDCLHLGRIASSSSSIFYFIACNIVYLYGTCECSMLMVCKILSSAVCLVCFGMHFGPMALGRTFPHQILKFAFPCKVVGFCCGIYHFSLQSLIVLICLLLNVTGAHWVNLHSVCWKVAFHPACFLAPMSSTVLTQAS